MSSLVHAVIIHTVNFDDISSPYVVNDISTGDNLSVVFYVKMDIGDVYRKGSLSFRYNLASGMTDNADIIYTYDDGNTLFTLHEYYTVVILKSSIITVFDGVGVHEYLISQFSPSINNAYLGSKYHDYPGRLKSAPWYELSGLDPLQSSDIVTTQRLHTHSS
jgi:hypothetical protein